MKTVIPAQPGFFVIYPNERKVPVIAWELREYKAHDFDVWPVTSEGLPDVGCLITYFDEHGSVVWSYGI